MKGAVRFNVGTLHYFYMINKSGIYRLYVWYTKLNSVSLQYGIYFFYSNLLIETDIFGGV